MLNLNTSPENISRAAEILKNGGLAAFPTETVYGLGADAFNTTALARVFEVKGRPRFDPLIVHIASLDTLDQTTCLDALDQNRLEILIHSFWPGPLTLVLPKHPDLPGLVTAGLSTAAIRFPSHPIARQLIALSTGAVAAPSANPFGRLSPTRAEHVTEALGEQIDCIIDGGPCPVGVESTVLELLPVPRILRSGGISREQLEAVIGPVADSDQRITYPASPGMLKSHYAPGIPLYSHSGEEMAALPYHAEEGYLFFSGKNRDNWQERTKAGQRQGDCPPSQTVLVLSEKGNVTEAAANLFECLHILEKKTLRCIHAETLPKEGLGEAVNDRLRRASVN
ncbi:MAG: L-threonylcarbamoyladenylate synthase [Treponema sp.]|nr:L-threonylcarbamoyladenylate synthase [Treponema sp.]